MRGFIRVVAIMVAIGAVLVTVTGIVGPPILALLQHPAGSSRAQTSPGTIQGRPYSGNAASESVLDKREANRIVEARALAASAGGHHVDQTRPFRVLTSGRATLVLPQRTAAYPMSELASVAPDSVRADGNDTTFDVAEHLLVMPGATLQIDAGQTIRLLSESSGFSSIVSAGGTIQVEGNAQTRSVIESWDTSTGSLDTSTSDGRAYVRSIGGTLSIAGADIRNLGFWSGATGGLSASAPASTAATLGPVSTSSGTTTIAVAPAPSTSSRVQVTDVTIDSNAYGIALDGVARSAVEGSRITGSLVDGLLIRSAPDTTVTGTTISNNARDGINAAFSSRISLTGDRIANNGRNGATIDRRPPATGPNPVGATTAAASGAQLTKTTFDANARYGVEVAGGSGGEIRANKVTGGLMGIVVKNRAAQTEVSDNTVAGQAQHGIAVLDGARDITVDGNRIHGAAVGLYLRNAQAAVTANRVDDAAVDAISLVGSLGGARVSGNTITGTGASAIDVARSHHAHVENNLVDGWVASQSLEQVVRGVLSPLTIVWSAVLALVALAVLWRLGSKERRRQRAPLQQFSRGVFTREMAGQLR